MTGDVDYNLVTDKQKRLLAERQALFFSDPHTWDLYAKVRRRGWRCQEKVAPFLPKR